MNIVRNIVVPFLLGGAIAACSSGSDNDSVFRYISVIDNTHIAVHAHSAADAIVTASGELSIAGKSVAVTPIQQDLLKRYFDGVISLRKDAIATGKAGVGTAEQAIGSVIAGIASGNADKIGTDVDAQAAKVDAAAAMVCKDLAAIHITQDAIADQLPAFQPYAQIGARQVSDCTRG